MDAVFNRRSIRKFKDIPVSDERLRLLLKAAMAAPNALSSNEWEFLVITSIEGRRKIIECQSHATAAETAAAVIIVCGNTELERCNIFLQQDCCAALENILICASALNIGSVWLGIVDDTIPKLRKAFNIPEHVLPVGMTAIGIADEKKAGHDRYYPDKVHFEMF